MQCITITLQWKQNLELGSYTNDAAVAFAKITGKDGEWKKKCLHHFLADHKIFSLWVGKNLGLVIACCQANSDYRPSKMPIKVGTVLHKFTVTAFHCEESTHWK